MRRFVGALSDLLVENGEPVQYVAERLGDRVETVIETYAHVTSKMRAVAPHDSRR